MSINLFPAFIVIAIIVVVCLTEIVKKWDSKGRLKGWYIFLPAVFSAGVSVLLGYGNFFDRQQVFFWMAVIFALSVFCYEAILKRMHGLFGSDD